MNTFHLAPVEQRLDLLKVVVHAKPMVQTVMFLLVAAAAACAAVW